jgi:hypothetical protein
MLPSAQSSILPGARRCGKPEKQSGGHEARPRRSTAALGRSWRMGKGAAWWALAQQRNPRQQQMRMELEEKVKQGKGGPLAKLPGMARLSPFS